MRIQSSSSLTALAGALIFLGLLSACASTSGTGTYVTAAKAHRQTQRYSRDPLVRVEITTELSNIVDEEEPLKGPITQARLEQIEKAATDKALSEKSLVAKNDSTLARPTVLRELLAKNGVRRALDLHGASAVTSHPAPPEAPAIELKTLNSLATSQVEVSSSSNETPFIFDIPVTYNDRVSKWIRYFQTDGRKSFKTYLERSARFVPMIEDELQKAGLPKDLVYLAMIESGFRSDAASHMGAIGLWQFISATGRRYGLNIDWWIDERRDFFKSTKAAVAYMKELNGEFDSWYLVAASYNMGETGVRRLLKRHSTNNFWRLADLRALPRETTDYVPKIIAATLIAKAPALYGFRDLDYQVPFAFETVRVPGGTDLLNLASYLGVSGKYLMDLNPELTRGFIPREVKGHQIRVPKGATLMVSHFTRIQQQQSSDVAPGVTQEAAN